MRARGASFPVVVVGLSQLDFFPGGYLKKNLGYQKKNQAPNLKKESGLQNLILFSRVNPKKFEMLSAN